MKRISEKRIREIIREEIDIVISENTSILNENLPTGVTLNSADHGRGVLLNGVHGSELFVSSPDQISTLWFNGLNTYQHADRWVAFSFIMKDVGASGYDDRSEESKREIEHYLDISDPLGRGGRNSQLADHIMSTQRLIYADPMEAVFTTYSCYSNDPRMNLVQYGTGADIRVLGNCDVLYRTYNPIPTMSADIDGESRSWTTPYGDNRTRYVVYAPLGTLQNPERSDYDEYQHQRRSDRITYGNQPVIRNPNKWD
jgi:hypothetical protein